MAVSWDLQGVSVTVEVSTSGDLIGTPTPPVSLMPNSSGTNATPPGWTRTPTNMYCEWVPNIIRFRAGKGAGQESTGWMKFFVTTASGNLIANHSYRFAVSMRNWVATATSGQRALGSLNIAQYRANGTQIAGTAVSSPHADLIDAYADFAIVSGVITAETTSLQVDVFCTGQPSIPTGQYGIEYMSATLTDLNAVGDSPVVLWRDITCDVQSIDVRFGREQFNQRYEVSSLALKLDNRDGEYRFQNPHPFNFRPGRLVRVKAYHGTSTHNIAFHVIDRVSDTYELDGRQTVTVNCLDVTSLLGQTIVPQLSFAGVSNPPSGAGVAALIDLVDYPSLNINAGVWRIQHPIPATTRAIREVIGTICDGENSKFFAGKSGIMHYLDRAYTEFTWTQVTQTFLATPFDDPIIISDSVPNTSTHGFICPMDLRTEWNQSRIINQANLGKVSGVPVTVNNTQSQKDYGLKSKSQTDLMLFYDADVTTRATEVVNANAVADYRATGLSWNPVANPGSWPFTLSLFFNWLVRVIYHHPDYHWGWYTVTRIQAYEHHITPRSWITKVSLDQPIAYGEHVPIVPVYPGPDPGWDSSLWDQSVWDDVTVAGAVWDAGMNWESPKSKWGE